MQSVLPRAIFRRSPVSEQILYTVLFQHVSNIYATIKDIVWDLFLTLRVIIISKKMDSIEGEIQETTHLQCVLRLRHRVPYNFGTLIYPRQLSKRLLIFQTKGSHPLWKKA